ncbi:MAG: hypothetical protein OEQ53_11070 [Saprospiraceae bacterium]|nr:hypothetical protein [Saprospiraceae bacterium]
MNGLHVSSEIILSVLKDKAVYNDSLSHHFRRATWSGVGNLLGISTAGYEALKTEGLDIISSKKTRSEIIDYFDNELQELKVRIERPLVQKVITEEYYIKSFYQSYDKAFIPIEYDQLIEDQFCYSLYMKLYTERKVLIMFISRALERAEQVLVLIKDELGE